LFLEKQADFYEELLSRAVGRLGRGSDFTDIRTCIDVEVLQSDEFSHPKQPLTEEKINL